MPRCSSRRLMPRVDSLSGIRDDERDMNWAEDGNPRPFHPPNGAIVGGQVLTSTGNVSVSRRMVKAIAITRVREQRL